MRNVQGTPAIIAGDSQAIFERVFLGKGVFSENWLQQLINDHPSILPLAEIEPGFGTPVAAAMEVSTAHGFIDNLFLTPGGEIVLVEAKLWSNVESRRKVVAQALDYVAALTGQDYSSFERMVMAARGSTGLQTLHGLVAEHADALGEPAFIDAVSRNLQHGRMVVIVLGDGIRSEARALAQLLQSHAGAHFTFALVELAIWKNPLPCLHDCGSPR